MRSSPAWNSRLESVVLGVLATECLDADDEEEAVLRCRPPLLGALVPYALGHCVVSDIAASGTLMASN
jgi:hypothetical protein